MFATKSFRYSGYVPAHKEATAHCAITDMPLPDEVVIPLGRYGGRFCEPSVAVADKVSAGQVIGRGLRLRAFCHASVAGEVVAVTQCIDAAGDIVPAVRIRVGEAGRSFSPAPAKVPAAMSAEELLEVLVHAGVQENDAAGNSLYTRIAEAVNSKIGRIVVNGIESEPCLTAHSRSLLERSALLIYGVRGMLKLTGAAKCVLALPKGAHRAIALYTCLLADEPAIRVVTHDANYPRGGHSDLARLEKGGALVLNPDTVVAYGDALVSGRPVLDCVISVSGELVGRPGNYRVAIGTPLSHVLEQCEVSADAQSIVVWGGPMRGIALRRLDVPIVPSCHGIVVLSGADALRKVRTFTDCVNCTTCVEHCPQTLYPHRLSQAAEKGRLDAASRLHISDCEECGMCSYVCPAHRPVTQMIRACKAGLRDLKAGEGR